VPEPLIAIVGFVRWNSVTPPVENVGLVWLALTSMVLLATSVVCGSMTAVVLPSSPRKPTMLGTLVQVSLAVIRPVSVQSCEKSAARDNWWDDYVFLAAGYAQLGQTAKAASAKAELLKQKPNFNLEQRRNTDPGLSVPSYARRVELHLYSGLTKAGLSDQ